MKQAAILLIILTLALSACSVDYNPPPISFTPPAVEPSATPIVLQATTTFTPLPAATSTDLPATASETRILPTVTDTQIPLPPTNTLLPPTPTASKPTLSVDQLRNATLTFIGSDLISRTFTLKDGRYQKGTDRAKPGYVSITLGDKIAFGDLNGDGLLDAAITIAENFGGSGTFLSVVAIINQAGQPVAVTSALIDDRPILNDLAIQNGEIFVDAIIHGLTDPMCCPGLPTKRNYRMLDNELLLTQYSATTPGGNERIVKVATPSDGAVINSPFVIKGSVSSSPFENTLSYKVFEQGASDPAIQSSFVITGDGLGGPGTFELPLDLSSLNFKGPVRVEIADISAADGSYLAFKALFLTLQ